MALTLENFQTLINHKFFVSIESAQDVLAFTGLESGGLGEQLRNAATTANVIVFLPSINKIFARGAYYGFEATELAQLQTGLSNLENTVTTLGTSLSSLAGLVHDHDTAITNNTTTLASHTNELSEITNNITNLQRDVAALSPNNQSLTELIEAAVQDALNDQLETALGSSTTISNINSSISNITTSLANKAEKDAFDELCVKVGIQSWVWIDEEHLQPGQTNISIVDHLNTLTQNVSQIPHFAIQIVDANSLGLPDVAQQSISKTTIYLVRSANGADANNNEIFTEYIYVDKNKNKYVIDSETGEPTDTPLPEDWGWESLGRQYFNVTNYLTTEQIEAIKGQLESSITAIQNQLGNADTAQIAINQSNITALQTSVLALQTTLSNIVDSNGNFKLTGEDINTTSANNSNTIATDISNLQSTKLDSSALSWVIIDNSQNNQEEPETNP